MPGGRPTTYDPAYCERVIELGREGASKAEMAADLDCARSTFTLWEAEHEEFSASVKQAVNYSQAWWEAKGRIATFGGVDGFNATAFIFNMKNRFPADWKDKQEVDQTTTLTASDPFMAMLERIATSGRRLVGSGGER